MTHVNTGHGALIRNKHTIIWPKMTISIRKMVFFTPKTILVDKSVRKYRSIRILRPTN